MANLKNAFKGRTIGFYLLLASAVVSFVTALLYLIFDGADRTFNLIGFILIVVGAISVILTVITDLSFAPLIPSVLYSVGLVVIMNVVFPSLSDVWNGVTFIGGNGIMGAVFGGIFLIADIASIVSCFLNQRKKESVAEAE